MFQKGQSRARMPIFTSLGGWFAYCRRFTARTQGHYRMVLNQFVAGLPIRFIEELRPKHINDYISGLLSKGRSNRCCNAHLTGIKSFTHWLSDNYGLDNPAEKIKMLKEDPPKRTHLSHADYLKTLACCDGDSDAIQFLASSGIRATEATSLSWDDISGDMKWITVRKGKGRKQRTIPTNSTIREILSHYNRRSGTHINLLKNNRQGLYRLCRKISKQSGVKISPQILRRYFCNRLSDNNIPLSHLMLLMGHSSLKTTQAYLNSQPDLSGLTEVLSD